MKCWGGIATVKCRLYKYQHKIQILDPSTTIKPPYSYKNIFHVSTKPFRSIFYILEKNTLHSCLWLRQNEEQRTQQLQQKLINISHLPGNIVCVTRHFISDIWQKHRLKYLYVPVYIPGPLWLYAAPDHNEYRQISSSYPNLWANQWCDVVDLSIKDLRNILNLRNIGRDTRR